MNKAQYESLIPKPVLLEKRGGVCSLTPESRICVQAGSTWALQAAEYLAGRLRPLTGLPLPVEEAAQAFEPGCIYFTAQGAGTELGKRATSSAPRRVFDHQSPGICWVFYGCQTLRQLLPPAEGPWEIPGVFIEDYPRFPWRGPCWMWPGAFSPWMRLSACWIFWRLTSSTACTCT